MARILVLPEERPAGARMSPGDHAVLQALIQLDDAWQVAVKPTIGDTAPDFVAMHSEFGVCALTVCDWAVGMFRRSCNGSIEVRGATSWHPTGEAPRLAALQQRHAIFNRFFASEADVDASIVRGAVVLPQYSTADACALLHRPRLVDNSNWIEVWGGAELREHTACVLTGDPRLRPRAVPRAAFERLLQAFSYDVSLRVA